MGLKIAATGIVIFCFCLFVGMIANSEPKQPKMVNIFGFGVLTGMFLVPIGLVIQIWQ